MQKLTRPKITVCKNGGELCNVTNKTKEIIVIVLPNKFKINCIFFNFGFVIFSSLNSVEIILIEIIKETVFFVNRFYLKIN